MDTTMETAEQVDARRAHAYDLPPKNHPHYADAVARRILNARTRARRQAIIDSGAVPIGGWA